MNRLLFSFAFVYAGVTCSLAQVQQQYLQDPGQLGKPLETSTGMEIQGNPYFLEGWSAGLASLTKEGAFFKYSKLRYNVLKEQVEFDNNGKALYLDPSVFSQFIIIQGSDSLLFRNKIEGIKSIPQLAYAQIAFNGNNTWIIKPTKSLMNDPDATYGSTKKKVIQSDNSFFVIKSNKEVLSFKMNVRSISKSLGVQSKPFTDFLNEKGYSLENPKHYKLVFVWLDAQVK